MKNWEYLGYYSTWSSYSISVDDMDLLAIVNFDYGAGGFYILQKNVGNGQVTITPLKTSSFVTVSSSGSNTIIAETRDAVFKAYILRF